MTDHDAPPLYARGHYRIVRYDATDQAGGGISAHRFAVVTTAGVLLRETLGFDEARAWIDLQAEAADMRATPRPPKRGCRR